jgi:hypothetical protein
MRLGDLRHLAEPPEATRLVVAEDDDVGGFGLEDRSELADRIDSLVRGNLWLHRASNLCQTADVLISRSGRPQSERPMPHSRRRGA